MANDNQKIIFSHPNIGLPDLILDTNPDQIVWSYGLNTQNYQTFGGEVVQILSMFIDDMTIAGTVKSYKKMEKIYEWFVAYMQLSTQGNRQLYDTTPITFYYPARGWKFLLQPKAAPGFKYGTQVVAPTWSLKATVVESPESFENLIKTEAEMNAMQDPAFKPFGKATARIGFSEFNPWTTPNTGKVYKKGATGKYFQQLTGDNGPYNKFLHAWVEEGNDATLAEALGANWSKPAFMSPGLSSAGGAQTATGNAPRSDSDNSENG